MMRKRSLVALGLCALLLLSACGKEALMPGQTAPAAQKLAAPQYPEMVLYPRGAIQVWTKTISLGKKA